MSVSIVTNILLKKTTTAAASTTRMKSRLLRLHGYLIFQQAAPDRIFDQFGAAVEIKLIHHMCAMCIHCLRTNYQAFRDLVIRITLRNQFQNFTFTLGQTAVTITLLTVAHTLQ